MILWPNMIFKIIGPKGVQVSFHCLAGHTPCPQWGLRSPHPPPSPTICLILNKFVHPHPQPHTHAHAHAHARARTQRVWKNTLQNLQCFLLIANENDKGLLDTTHIIIISRQQIYAVKPPCKSHLYKKRGLQGNV